MVLLDDERYMRRALRLAGLGRHASPNPMVGCVIVDAHGHVVGEGYHHTPGGPHAEVWALRSAGEGGARAATAYVTLEPCSHFGRTPPCANALIDAGVARVVVAMADPDTRVSGNGIDRLRAAGIDVTVGVLEDEARKLLAAYIKHRSTGLPWVVLKSAMTLDGKIATSTGDSRWISSPISRASVHRQLRDRCDAILCGVGTIIADDSQLTTRLSRGGRDPWRVIVDSRGRTPADAKVVRQSGEDGKTIIATTGSAPAEALETFANSGCQILMCGEDEHGRVFLPDLMAQLGTRGDIVGVLAETGAALSASLLDAGLIDRWLVFIAPKIVGGATAPGPIGGLGIGEMMSAIRVKNWQVNRCGPDVRIDAKLG
jgi:diaminohydroxyphosphoribosylaminopyrimidine deaminase/5-amino-6-(5-phosphoribosylamino)uracil reductase